VKKKLVVIGNGMVGHQFCEDLIRKEGNQHYQIQVFGTEPTPAYDRIELHDILTGKPIEQLLLRNRDWYEENAIELNSNRTVNGIQRSEKNITLNTGDVVAYDQLVLATGARAHLPPIEGTDLPGVYVYRSAKDADTIREACQSVDQATILGGGVLGLEIAMTLQNLGLTVSIIESLPQLMSQQLDTTSARVLLKKFKQQNIKITLNTLVQSIENSEGKTRLKLNSGSTEDTDMVIIATGVKPRDELAKQCGLACHERGGILVNEYLATNDPHIFAIGECAAPEGKWYGLVAPGYKMASVLVSNLLGNRETFQPSPCPFLSKPGVSDIGVITVGELASSAPHYESLIYQNKHRFRQLSYDQGKLVGAVSLGDWPELYYVQDAIKKQKVLRSWEKLRFKWTGRLRSSSVRHTSYLPKTAVVCHCMGITQEALSLSYCNGNTTPEKLAQNTGASTVCGACRPILNEFTVSAQVQALSFRSKRLLAYSFMALFTIGWFLFAQPWPRSLPYEFSREVNYWETSIGQQVTGFLMVALIMVGLMLSLRKRTKWFRWGKISTWRLVHSGCAAGALGVLVLHTGGHWGEQFNFWLMLHFLVLASFGTFLGLFMPFDVRLAQYFSALTVKKIQLGLTTIHYVLYTFLPFLVLFHTVATYYY
jgi:nitrite reductase (NADH) large subunit